MTPLLEQELTALIAGDREAGRFTNGFRRAAAGWDQRLSDPRATETERQIAHVELGIARAARIMVASHEGSPFYAEAQREDRLLRERRRELWAKQLQEREA